MNDRSCDVVIATRNRLAPLRRCLGGLRAQSIPRFNVIVVDDHSDTPIADGLSPDDTIGLDIGANVAKELGQSVPDNSRFSALVAAKKLGRKTGEGYYKWVDGKAQKGEVPAHGDLAALGRELVKPLVDMTETVVAEKVVASADLADIGVILGTGFAPFLGGPMKARRDGRA